MTMTRSDIAKSIVNLHSPDISKRIIARRKYLNEIVKIDDEGYWVITMENGSTYDIELSRIGNERNLLGWLSHLSDKEWVTKEILVEVLHRVSGNKGWRIHPI